MVLLHVYGILAYKGNRVTIFLRKKSIFKLSKPKNLNSIIKQRIIFILFSIFSKCIQIQ